jgi:hypothetical protein
MNTTHKTAEAALADCSPGSRALQCTLSEAIKLASTPATTVHGAPAWYDTPVAYAPGNRIDDPNARWIVGVVTDIEAARRSLAAVKANYQI